jgi:hypothetical protein
MSGTVDELCSMAQDKLRVVCGGETLESADEEHMHALRFAAEDDGRVNEHNPNNQLF